MVKRSILVTHWWSAAVECQPKIRFDVLFNKNEKLLMHTDLKEAIKPYDAASRQRDAGRAQSNGILSD